MGTASEYLKSRHFWKVAYIVIIYIGISIRMSAKETI